MKCIAILLCSIALFAPTCALAQDAGGQQAPVRDAFKVQEARAAAAEARATRLYYRPGQFNLSDLSAYVPEASINGPIRIWASDMWGNPGFQEKLEAAFRKFQPNASLDYVSASPSGAFAGLLTGQADVAIARRMTWVDLLSYQRKFGRDPLVIRGMTGWFVNPPFVISVNRENPVRNLTLAQIDGIFGAERDGGWKGTSWDPSLARGPEKNIRTWGQLGLKGSWTQKQIDPYGYNLAYLFAPRFSEDILGNSNKWNEHLRQFTIYASKDGQLVSVDQQMADAVAANPASIAYYAPGRGINPKTRPVPIELADGRLVTATIDAVRDHLYPFTDSMWFYASRSASGQVDPKVREFLRFILSREGQEVVNQDTTMLPLTAALAAQELKKIN
jgi:phosphate transport system substrate-binding protein